MSISNKKYDLVICGGGTAGISAGYIAAKYGLKTLIVEKNIHLGGTITSGLVIPAMKSNTSDVNCEFYNDFITELKKYNGQVTYSDGNNGWFNPELSKIALDSLMQKVNCEILYNTEVIDANFDESHVYNIKISSNILSLHIESLYFADATGNANLCEILKSEFIENNSSRQPMSLRFHVSGVNINEFEKWITKLDSNREVTSSCKIGDQIHLSTACTWDTDRKWALYPIFDAAIKNGDLKPSDTAYFQLFTIPSMPGTVSLNCPRLLSDNPIDPLDVFEVSNLLIDGRQQIWRLYCFMRKYFPGFQESYISNIADMVGIRESRRVLGKYVFTKEDLLSGETLNNPVLHADYPIDIHSYNKTSKGIEKLTIDYELPIECLMHSKYANVFVIGRALSADFEAQAALRIQTSCFSMGEAVAKHVVKILKN